MTDVFIVFFGVLSLVFAALVLLLRHGGIAWSLALAVAAAAVGMSLALLSSIPGTGAVSYADFKPHCDFKSKPVTKP
jgi:hypothetical protein